MHRLILAALLLVCAPAMAQTPVVDSITLRSGGHIIGMPSADVVGALGFAPVNPSALGNIAGLNLGANLTSGEGNLSLTNGNVTGALGYPPMNPANNLSEVNPAAARAVLGLGAVAPIGTTVGTVAAGNDSRIVGAAQTSALGNVSGLNIGITAGTVAAGNDSRIVGAFPTASAGNAATRNVGTGFGTVAAGDDPRLVGALPFTHAIGLSNWIGPTEGGVSSNSAVSETTRVIYTTKGAVSQLQLFLPTQAANNGIEIPAYNPVFYAASVEYPLGANPTPPQFTLAGQSTMQVGIAGSGVLTDPLGITIPPGVQFAIRYATMVAAPPASIALTGSTAGGALPAATYYYKATCNISGVESGPTAEVSVVTTGSTSAVSITATPTISPLGCRSINIYRATSSGAEAYLANLPGPGLVYIDTGALATTAGSVPPAVQRYSFSDTLPSTASTTEVGCGGNQANSVVGTGVLGVVGPNLNGCNVNMPIVVADDVLSPAICGLGDSIQAGFGIQSGSVASPAGDDFKSGNWFARSLPQGSYNVLNLSLPSTQARSFLSQAVFGAAMRQRALNFCTAIVSNMVTNDLIAGATWQNVAIYHTQIAQAQFNRGRKYFITTALPRGLSTDSMVTEGNYTVDSHESQRLAYNAWVRGGMRMSAGVPVASGGTPTPYITGWFDLAQALGETNSANVPTMDGGYWPVPSTPYGTAVVTAGSSGNFINYSSWSGGSNANYAMVGMVVKITSGSQTGQTCIVNPGNGNSVIFCGYGFTIAIGSLSIGDTLAVWQTPGVDGVHPSLYGNILISSGPSGFAAWASANLN